MIGPRRIPVTTLLRCLIAAAGLLPWGLLLLGHGGFRLAPAFRALCHQIPDRTLSIGGIRMVVCSRCAGIYLGVALGALLPSPSWPARWWRLLILLAGVFMALDVATQDLGLHPPIHALRLSTGLAIGWTASAFLFAVLNRESRAM